MTKWRKARGGGKKRHIICARSTELGRYSGPSGRAEGAGTARRAKSATKSAATELKGPRERAGLGRFKVAIRTRDGAEVD